MREKGRQKDYGLSEILLHISAIALSMDTPQWTRRIASLEMWDTAFAKDIPYSGKKYRMGLEKSTINFTLGSEAEYISIKDVIRVPPRKCFTSSASFRHVLLHEIGHWTGHYRRNGRIPRNGLLSRRLKSWPCRKPGSRILSFWTVGTGSFSSTSSPGRK